MLWFWITFISAILHGTKDVLAKQVLTVKGLSASSMVFQRDLLMFILMLFCFPFVDFLSIKELWFIFLCKGIFVLLAVNIYYTLLNKYQISVVTPMMNLSPIFLIFIASILLGEQITYIQLIGIIIIVIATYLLEFFAHGHHTKKQYHSKISRLTFFGLVIIMLITFSIVASLDMIIVSSVNVFTNMFFSSLIVVVGMLLYGVATKKYVAYFTDIIRTPKSLLVSFTDNVSVLMVVTAMTLPGALITLIIPIRRLASLFSAFFGGLLFHENHLFKKMCCVVLMIVGTVLIVI